MSTTKRKMVEYIVVFEPSVQKLAVEVMRRCNEEGYEPIGGVGTNGGFHYTQTLVKYEEDKG